MSHKSVSIETIEELVKLAVDERQPAGKFTFEERTKPAYLSEAGRSYAHSYSIILSDDLAGKIDAIWTKRPAWRGSKYTKPAGMMTLAGILKRLGKTDVAAQIAAAKKEETARIEKIKRNNIRRQLRDAAAKLQTLINENSEVIDIVLPHITDDLRNLCTLKDEE